VTDEVVARYERPDVSDKRDDETWTAYWARKRRIKHGSNCCCHLCWLDQPEPRTECGHSMATCHTTRCFMRLEIQTNEDGPIECEEL
jgi:hypothetical protein